MRPKKTVVIIHGILMPCAQLLAMQKRLQRQGYTAYRFCYQTIARTMAENASALDDFLTRKGIADCHFVGHSMGGLVIHRFLQDRPDFPPCRVVALGSPFAGSVVARRLSQWPMVRSIIIGKKRGSSLEHGVASWPRQHLLGVIAGDKPLGIGCMLAKLPKPHDGVVSLEETRIAGMAERVIIPVNHMGLMFSRQAAALTEGFLEYGSFEQTPPNGTVKAGADQT